MTEIAPTVLGCGNTIDELSDYLTADRTPPDPKIETCPECLNALAGLNRVAELSRDLLIHERTRRAAPSESWFSAVIANIAREARAGRSLPLHHDNPQVRLSITEGAVRALVRAVGDDIDGVVVGNTRIDGDVESLNAPVAITVTANTAWSQPAQQLAETLRSGIHDALRKHTHLHVTAVNIVINDLYGYTRQEEATR
ncbi:Asp23/Gls24 family envelope stress response protein [Salinibacterium sp. TMP30]|uniref:Asp23/Gls24 family envelope stress response protein n=1 Tax=Salinibacterium sp. TMP30 TaxID=3138237 RepID=UPI0031387AF0